MATAINQTALTVLTEEGVFLTKLDGNLTDECYKLRTFLNNNQPVIIPSQPATNSMKAQPAKVKFTNGFEGSYCYIPLNLLQDKTVVAYPEQDNSLSIKLTPVTQVNVDTTQTPFIW